MVGKLNVVFSHTIHAIGGSACWASIYVPYRTLYARSGGAHGGQAYRGVSRATHVIDGSAWWANPSHPYRALYA